MNNKKYFTKYIYKNIPYKYFDNRFDYFLKTYFNINWFLLNKCIKNKTILLKSYNNQDKYKIIQNGCYRIKNKDILCIEENIYDNIREIKEKHKDCSFIQNNKEYYFDLLKEMIVYENQELLVLNKYPNISSQGGKIDLHLIPLINNYFKLNDKLHEDNIYPKIIHRWDRFTSGLILIPLNNSFTRHLGKLFYENKIIKKYTSINKLIEKNLNLKYENDIKCYIQVLENKSKVSIINEKIDKFSKVAYTNYKIYKIIIFNNDTNENEEFKINSQSDLSKLLIKYNNDKFDIFLFLEFKILNGRKHQIRVISNEFLKAPVLNDLKYNKNSKIKKEQLDLFYKYIKDNEYMKKNYLDNNLFFLKSYFIKFEDYIFELNKY